MERFYGTVSKYRGNKHTNAAGDYLFDNIPEGIYIVVVVMEGYNSPPSDPVNITDEVISGTVNFSVDAATQIIEADMPFVVAGVENIFFTDLKVYPNPFTDRVWITGATTITTKGQASLLKVINAVGVIVHTQEINSPDETILLEHLPAGVYFFMVEKNEVAKERNVKTVKVLKER